MYEAGNEQIFVAGQRLFEEMVRTGQLQPPDDPDFFDSLLTIAELIAQNRLSYLDRYDRPLTEVNLRKGSDIIIIYQATWCS